METQTEQNMEEKNQSIRESVVKDLKPFLSEEEYKKLIEELKKGNLQQVLDLNNALVFFALQIKTLAGTVKTELKDRFTETLRTVFKQKEKEHGEMSYAQDGIKLNFKIDRDVTWDQNKLKKILEDKPEILDKIVFVEFSVPEKIYSAITDDELLKKLEGARTVKYKDPEISFSKK